MNHIQRIIFSLVFFPLCLYAQSINFKNITTEDGLASSECYEIIQDKSGYMWIATDAGLCKYNGKEFKTFTTNDGLPSNTMFDILEDPYGRIWGGCFNGGIFYVQNDSVYTIAANSALLEQFNVSKEIIRKLIFDKKNILHVGTTGGYYQISQENNYNTITACPATDTGYTLIKQVEDDILYCRIPGNNFMPNRNKHVIQMAAWNSAVYINCRDKSLATSLYFAIKGNNQNLILTVSNSVFIYKERLLQRKDFNSHIIQVFLDDRNNLWLGTFGEGYLMYPDCNLSATPVKGLAGKNVSGFYQDREKGMWITTLDEGIFYCPNTSIYSYVELNGENVPAIGSCFGKIYLATSAHQVWMIKDSKINYQFSSNDIAHSEKMNFSFINDQAYLGGGKAFNFDQQNRYNCFFVNSPKYTIAITQFIGVNDTVLGINYEAIILLENNRQKEKILLPSRGICIFYSSNKEILIGCMDGLYQFRSGKFDKISISSPMKDVRISFITEDKDHNLVLSTRGHGIFIRVNNSWYNFNTTHGLPSNLCNHVHCATNGKYYISTNKGLCIYSPGSKIPVKNINISNGLLTNEVNMCTNDSGIIYVATEKGLCYFNDQMEVYNTSLPPLTIRTIELGEDKLIANKRYSYDKNDLRFEWDVLSYQGPKDNQIQYQLFPIDKTAKYSSSSAINYDNLSPGEYTLIIWPVNNNGIRGIPLRYHFTIQNPFWNTWWFILMVAVILFATTYIFVRQRIHYIRRSAEEKNLLKEKIVEYHYTALRAQMNPHFIFNVINSIQLYVLNNQPKEAYNYLSKFSKLIRKVLQNSKEKLISLSDELETIRLYVELEQIRLEGSVEFRIKVDPSIDQEYTMIPSMIIQPLLENAIWHGIVPLKASRKGIVSLCISSYHQMFRIQIRDNGNGIDPNKPVEEKGSFGLNLIKDRLALLSDQTQMEIANLMDENDQVQGVEVTILMPFIKK